MQLPRHVAGPYGNGQAAEDDPHAQIGQQRVKQGHQILVDLAHKVVAPPILFKKLTFADLADQRRSRSDVVRKIVVPIHHTPFFQVLQVVLGVILQEGGVDDPAKEQLHAEAKPEADQNHQSSQGTDLIQTCYAQGVPERLLHTQWAAVRDREGSCQVALPYCH